MISYSTIDTYMYIIHYTHTHTHTHTHKHTHTHTHMHTHTHTHTDTHAHTQKHTHTYTHTNAGIFLATRRANCAYDEQLMTSLQNRCNIYIIFYTQGPTFCF